jgi:histidinol phosphatase-like enzyme
MHHPRAVVETLRATCDCRKPRPGLVRQAQARFRFDLARSFVVGDKLSDVGLASCVGARGVLVRTGHGEGEAARADATGAAPSIVAANLMEATAWILAQSGHPREES